MHERVQRAAGAAARVDGVVRMHGGASSLTYAAQLALSDQTSTPVVVKIAPPGLPPTRNRDVLRQGRVMRALESSPVPTPAVLFEDAGTPPDEPPVLVVTKESGECIEPLTHGAADDVPSQRIVRQRTLAAIELLAQMHEFPWKRSALGSEPVQTLAAEVNRWRALFATAPPDLAHGSVEVADRLLDQMPADIEPTLVHGDFRLGNMLCEGGRVTALLDWETWTIGDPRIDLGWLLMSSDASQQPHSVREDVGMPSRTEMLRHYAACGGGVTDHAGWFVALSQFKAAAMTALILKHDRRKVERDPFVAWWDPQIPLDFLKLAQDL
ncbi:phosphotransferase family protein [Nocardioides marmoriginsengisoli]|uniref:Phosphotransferase family protein n=1 Tax=Nocardioides marmoriginsengisoli TaxID=661483 RepID=A0A3N0CHF8_9ACTN|nr:phosphotransferase family protein [Nocardioides marmoriginsengisoli]